MYHTSMAHGEDVDDDFAVVEAPLVAAAQGAITKQPHEHPFEASAAIAPLLTFSSASSTSSASSCLSSSSPRMLPPTDLLAPTADAATIRAALPHPLADPDAFSRAEPRLPEPFASTTTIAIGATGATSNIPTSAASALKTALKPRSKTTLPAAAASTKDSATGTAKEAAAKDTSKETVKETAKPPAKETAAAATVKAPTLAPLTRPGTGAKERPSTSTSPAAMRNAAAPLAKKGAPAASAAVAAAAPSAAAKAAAPPPSPPPTANASLGYEEGGMKGARGDDGGRLRRRDSGDTGLPHHHPPQELPSPESGPTGRLLSMIQVVMEQCLAREEAARRQLSQELERARGFVRRWVLLFFGLSGGTLAAVGAAWVAVTLGRLQAELGATRAELAAVKEECARAEARWQDAQFAMVQIQQQRRLWGGEPWERDRHGGGCVIC